MPSIENRIFKSLTITHTFKSWNLVTPPPHTFKSWKFWLQVFFSGSVV